MVLAFVPMYFIAVAYSELNKAEPDCGTTFTWAARAFGTRTGWLGGWGIIAADIIVMANLAQIAGSYSFRLFGSRRAWRRARSGARSPGVVWITVMTYICYRGIEVSARLQYALLGVEVLVLIAFALFALVEGLRRRRPGRVLKPSLVLAVALAGCRSDVDRHRPSSSRCSSTGAGTPRSPSTRSPTTPARTPGRAAVISTVLLLVTYALVSVATIAFAGSARRASGWATRTTPTTCSRPWATRSSAAAPSAGSWCTCWSICVLTSASASTQTTILPTARTSLSMAAFGRSRGASPDPPEVPHAHRLDHVDGRRLDHLLRRPHADQREHPGRHHRGRRPDDRVLLRTHRLRVRRGSTARPCGASRATS